MSSQIIPVPAVNAAIMNDKNELLLTRRSPTIREPGKWCLPGGHIEGGETWAAAMRREIWEEVGLTVTGEKLLGVYSDPALTIGPDTVPAKQFVVVVFLVTSFTGEVKPNDEVDLWDWFPPGRLPDPMIRSHPIRVADAFDFRGEAFFR